MRDVHEKQAYLFDRIFGTIGMLTIKDLSRPKRVKKNKMTWIKSSKLIDSLLFSYYKGSGNFIRY